MPATPLTVESKAIADRMETWANVGGNLHVVDQMANHDAATIEALRVEVAGLADPAAPDGMAESLADASRHASNVIPLGGNLQLLAIFVADGANVRAAATFVESWEANPPPVDPPTEPEPEEPAP
jgi:hypothetical protein